MTFSRLKGKSVTQSSNKHLLIIGAGYSAGYIGALFLKSGFKVSATTRSDNHLENIEALGFHPLLIKAGEIEGLPNDISHIVMTAPVSIEIKDTVWSTLTAQITGLKQLEWLCYLSTTGVYGDQGGALTSEDTPTNPMSARAKSRVIAEKKWCDLSRRLQKPLDILRLSGIYGPNRNILRSLIDGNARVIIKEGQIFNRCHVKDIASAVYTASINMGQNIRVFNVADDAPCTPLEITSYAAQLLKMPIPKEVPFDKATLSPMARSFYMENKRIDNSALKNELGIKLKYPDYRQALQDMLKSELAKEAQ